MKKHSVFIFLILWIPLLLSAASPDSGEKSALTLRANALLKENAQESLHYLISHISLASSDQERRSILYYTGTLQEQLGYYADAATTYAAAASIRAEDAKGMPSVSNAQLYLYAARASLGAGDFESADTYLDASSLNSSKNKEIIARKRLYSAWSALCKASDYEDAKGAVANLRSFVNDGLMQSVRPTVLFTLWYLTGESLYASMLREDYPSSPEVYIIDDKLQMMGMPFWYFVPRAKALSFGEQAEKTPPQVQVEKEPEKPVVAKPAATVAETLSPVPKMSVSPSSLDFTPRVKQQLGLFREKENADALIVRLKAKGFSAYSYEERRSNSMVYVVVVDENKANTMGEKLRAAGFECYPRED